MPFNNGEPNTFGKELKVYADNSKDYTIPSDQHILFMAEKLMPVGFLAEENKNILWFAKAVIDASKPIEQPLISG